MRVFRRYWDVAVILGILGVMLLARPADTHLGGEPAGLSAKFVPAGAPEPAAKPLHSPQSESARSDPGDRGRQRDDGAPRQWNVALANFQKLVAPASPDDSRSTGARSDATPFVGKLAADFDLPKPARSREPQPEPPALPTFGLNGGDGMTTVDDGFWPAGRDAALYWASGEAMPGAKLREAVDSPLIGPVGEAFLGMNGSWFDIDLGESAGRAGLKRLAAAAFANDYRPFLAGDSWLGEWFLSLAKALRQLDEPELKALARLLPEETPRDALLASWLLLKKDPDKPLQEVLPAALDSLWANVLFANVRSQLMDLANLFFGKPDEPHRDDQVRPALAEEETEETAWEEGVTEPEPFPNEDMEMKLKPVPESDRIPTARPVPVSDDEIPALPRSIP